MVEHVPIQKIQPVEPDPADKKGKKGKTIWSRGKNKKDEIEEEINEAELYQSPRPAFCANARGTKRTQVPRDVAVPYFRFRKDRFYDWPPDPTVSRATPLLVTAAKDTTKGFDPDEFDESTRRAFEERIYNTAASNKQSTTIRKRHTYNKRNQLEEEEDMDFGYGY
jgi:hypothetical protein